MTNKNELNANERTENMKEKETKNKTCHEEKSSLPSIRGGIKGEVIALLKPFSYLGFKRKKDSTSPLTPLLKEERGRKVAFTLAETLIALVILGIVAAITVPQLVRKHVERANRVKFKKAVMSYESVMNKIAIMNDLKSNDAIKNWATKDNTVSDCSIAYNYFKSVKDLSTDSKCKFKTADGVFWDITDLQKPIISIKEADLTDAVAKSDTNRAFYLYAQYDGTGILRVTEPNFNYTLTSDKTEVDASVDRLWAYLNGETNTSRAEVSSGTSEKCTLKAGSQTDYTCEGSELTWKKNTLTAEEVLAASVTNSKFCNWDPDNNNCSALPDDTSTLSSDTLYVSDELTLTSDEIAQSCVGTRATSCTVDYWNAYRKKCAANGAHLATAAELKALKTAGALSSAYYWAAEAYSDNSDFAIYFDNGFDIFKARTVTNTSRRAVCVNN